MRIGIIGLGDIARKAYLPIMTEIEGIELVLCTRNRETLHRLAAKYRVRETVETIDQLIHAGIDAAFIHSSTESHVQIAEQLLRQGIAVFVDKPISYHYEEAKRLVELAEQLGIPFMVGFNRRFAPMVAAMKEMEERRFVVMQKNRTYLPDYARRFVFDDFIHVVDTIRFLAPGEILETRVTPYVKEGKLHHVMLQLDGDGFSCIGIMNRDNGATEEMLEVMNPGNKWVIDGLNTTVHKAGSEVRQLTFKDWDPVLYRRGFVQMIDHFLACVREKQPLQITPQDALESHRLCDIIVNQAEESGALAFPTS
ncbi:oxidoreductase [Paenibacillus selenitireducens]|uniref:Oxidoreductase n=1 Tax=Paenibacillus selenitireducens TaxID=1324314 RepID=A0A1T2XLE1_9BACL|nr:Gfo/Idh/MocA family oxidoreductase [Paenibacillus selenitireducens]OPA80483.1 oxidoreductase [Paenibacillus selenitireducens]